MAEAILKQKNHPNIEVRSAGVFAENGADASPNAKAVLQENQITHQHKSTQLSEDDINWATHIFTMTTSHKDIVINHFPHSEKKIFTLKEYAGELNYLDVFDPYGGTIEVYRSSYEEINRMIKKVLDRLKIESD